MATCTWLLLLLCSLLAEIVEIQSACDSDAAAYATYGYRDAGGSVPWVFGGRLRGETFQADNNATAVTSSCSLAGGVTELHIYLEVELFNNLDDNWIMSQGDRNEGINIGILAATNSQNSVLRVYLQGVTPTPDLQSTVVWNPGDPPRLVEVVFHAANQQYELWVDGSLDQSSSCDTSSVISMPDSPLFFGVEAAGLGSNGGSPAAYLNGSVSWMFVGQDPIVYAQGDVCSGRGCISNASCSEAGYSPVLCEIVAQDNQETDVQGLGAYIDANLVCNAIGISPNNTWYAKATCSTAGVEVLSSGSIYEDGFDVAVDCPTGQTYGCLCYSEQSVDDHCTFGVTWDDDTGRCYSSVPVINSHRRRGVDQGSGAIVQAICPFSGTTVTTTSTLTTQATTLLTSSTSTSQSTRYSLTSSTSTSTTTSTTTSTFSTTSTATSEVQMLALLVADNFAAAGGGATCVALSETNGALKCFGLNEDGQLGLGDNTVRGTLRKQMGDRLPAVEVQTGTTVKRAFVGKTHTCAVQQDDTLTCWGNNNQGQLGLGQSAMTWGANPNEMGASLPGVDLGALNPVDVAVGSDHTCALLQHGEVKCWGNGLALGYGDSSPRGAGSVTMGSNLPSVMLGSSAFVTAIGAGEVFTCALLDAGDIKCWGDNALGQLGLDDTSHRGTDSSQMGNALPAVNLGSGRSAVSMSVGDDFACAVLDDGAVKCWGNNEFGTLGLGDITARGDGATYPVLGDNLPAVDLGSGALALEVACGKEVVCVLLSGSTQTVKCWGSGGNLGMGDGAPRGQSPGDMGDLLPAVDLGADQSPESIVTGQHHACSLLFDGSVKCWGSSQNGQLGLGISTSKGSADREMGDWLPNVLLTGYHLNYYQYYEYYTWLDMGCFSVAQSSTADGGAAYRAVDGQEDTDFYATAGAYGEGTCTSTQAEATPWWRVEFGDTYKIKKIIVLNRADDFGADLDGFDVYVGTTTCALSVSITAGQEKEVFCQTNTHGTELRISVNRTVGSSRLTFCELKVYASNRGGSRVEPSPLQPWCKNPFQSSTAGGDINFAAIRAADGSYDSDGINGLSCSTTNVEDSPYWGVELGDYYAVNTISVAIRSDSGFSEDMTHLTFLVGNPGTVCDGGNGITYAAGGGGTVQCNNITGHRVVVYRDTTSVALSLCEVFIDATLVENYNPVQVQIVAGKETSCARFSSGNLECWGFNTNGELGQGDTNSRGSSAGEMGNALPFIRFQGGAGPGATYVAANTGALHTCAVLQDGKAYCWGFNHVGQLGQGDTLTRGDSSSTLTEDLPPVQLLPTVLNVTVGGAHTCVLLQDSAQSSVKCWGFNNKGQLGLGDANDRGDEAGEIGDHVPSIELGVALVPVHVVAGDRHTCVMFSQGVVKCFGDNSAGQLGYEDTLNRGDAPGQMGDALPAVNLGKGVRNRALLIAAGGDVTCALLRNFRVKCWGTNLDGQLGLGDTAGRGAAAGDMGDQLQAVDIPGAKSVATSGTHTCAVVGEFLRCWGSNSNGQLGQDDLNNRGDGPGEMGDALPDIVLGDTVDLYPNVGSIAGETQAGRVGSLALGLYHTCVLLGGSETWSVKCFGGNSYGQLGYGDTTDRGGSSSDMASLPSVDLGSATTSTTTTSTTSSSSTSTLSTTSSTSSTSTTTSALSAPSSSSSSSTSTSSPSSSSSSTTTSTSLSISTSSSTSASSTSTTAVTALVSTSTGTSTSTLSSTATSSSTSTETSTSSSSLTSSVTSTSSFTSTGITTTSTASSRTTTVTSTSSPSTRSSQSSSSTSPSSFTSTSTTLSRSTSSSSSTSRSSTSISSTSSSTTTSQSSFTSSSSHTSSRSTFSSSTSTSTSLAGAESSSSSSSTTTSSFTTSSTAESSTSTSSSTRTSATQSSTSTSSKTTSSTHTSSSQGTSTSSSTSIGSSATSTSSSISSHTSTSTFTSDRVTTRVETTSTSTTASSMLTTSTSTSNTQSTTSSSTSGSSTSTRSTTSTFTSTSSATTSSTATSTTLSSTTTHTSTSTSLSTSSTSTTTTTTVSSISTSSTTSVTSSSTSSSSITTVSSSSTSTTTSSSSTTVSDGILISDYWFSAEGLTAQQVRESCRNSLAQYFDVDADTKVGCTTQTQTASRRLVSVRPNATANDTVDDTGAPVARVTRRLQSVWTVIFSVSVLAALESAGRDLLETLLADPSAFSSLLEQALIDIVGDSSALAFSMGTFAEPPPDNVVTALVAEVERQQATLVEDLLSGNSSRLNVSVEGMTVVAERIDTSEAANSTEDIVLEVNEEVSVSVSPETLADLGTPEGLDIVIVVTPLTAIVTEDSSTGANASDDAGEDASADTTVVQASIKIDIYDSEGGLYSIRNLENPIQFSFTLPEGVEDLECAVWDPYIPDWSSDGVSVVSRTNTTLVCQTTHLSLFAAIARGFLQGLKCSQADLFKAESFEELMKGKWFYQFGAIVLWVVLLLFFGMMAYAITLDVKRRSRWTDTNFLIPEQDAAQLVDGEGDAGGGNATVIASIVAFCSLCAQYSEVLWEVVSEIINEFFADMFEYIGEVRDICQGFCESMCEAIDPTAASRGGVLSTVLVLAAQRAIGTHAHRNACADLGVHHNDKYDLAIGEILEVAQKADAKKENQNPQSPTHASENQVDKDDQGTEPASPNSHQSPGGSQESFKEATSRAASPAGKRKLKSMNRGLSTQKSSLTDGSSVTAQRFAARAEHLEKLHIAQLERKEHHHENSHYFCSMPMKVARQLLKLGPLGSCFVFSIYAPSSLRVLLLFCDIFGAVAVATVFMELEGAAPDQGNDDECEDEPDLAGLFGRLLAIGVVSGFFAAFPLAIFRRLHTRKFQTIDYEDSPKYKTKLRSWFVQDVMLWILASAYGSFCVLYIMLFMANVAPEDQNAWIFTAGVAFLNDLMLTPLSIALAPAIIAGILVGILACYHRKSRNEMIDTILTWGHDDDGEAQEAAEEAEPTGDGANGDGNGNNGNAAAAEAEEDGENPIGTHVIVDVDHPYEGGGIRTSRTSEQRRLNEDIPPERTEGEDEPEVITVL